MKKLALFSVMILVSLFVSSCSSSLPAQETEQVSSASETEFVFAERPDGSLSLKKYEGDKTELVVPYEYDGKKITAIASFAFKDNENLNSVTLPEGMTTVEPCAFAGCTSLAEISLPESAVYISKESFSDTPWYSSLGEGFVAVNGTVLEYKGNEEALSSLEIPKGIRRIGDKAFAGLDVKSVTLPDSVTSVGERAFYGCDSLMKIVIPEGITHIGYAAFHDTAWFKMSGGAVVVGDILVGFGGAGNSTGIPKNVKTIAGGAFLGYKAIAVTIPEGVVTICDYAFSGCTQIVRISLPSTVSEIEPHAFEHCPTLQNVTVSADNPTYLSQNGILCDKTTSAELFSPEGKPAPESEKYDPRG